VNVGKAVFDLVVVCESVVDMLAVGVFGSVVYPSVVDICKSVIYLLIVDVFGSVDHRFTDIHSQIIDHRSKEIHS
jgi:hypothetical protein